MGKKRDDERFELLRRAIPLSGHDTPHYLACLLGVRQGIGWGGRKPFVVPVPLVTRITFRWSAFLNKELGWQAESSGWLVGRLCLADIEPRLPYIVVAAITERGDSVDAVELLGHFNKATVLQEAVVPVPAAFQSTLENDLANHFEITAQHWANERESHIFSLEIDHSVVWNPVMKDIESELRRRRQKLPPPEPPQAPKEIDKWKLTLQEIETEQLRLELQEAEDEELLFFNQLEDMRRQQPCWSSEPFLEIEWHCST